VLKCSHGITGTVFGGQIRLDSTHENETGQELPARKPAIPVYPANLD